MLKSYMHKGLVEAGCDEAGRGCLAGPVYAAAVILPPRVRLPKLDDSKKLTESVRNELRQKIEQNAISWAVASCTEREIEKYNILNCSILAMHRAIATLDFKPQHLLVDGNRFKPIDFIPFTTVVRGDSKYRSIAAASILAKTHRDDFMKEISKEFPEYGFENHKGYGTPQHIKAISKFGQVACHRKTFILKQFKAK